MLTYMKEDEEGEGGRERVNQNASNSNSTSDNSLDAKSPTNPSRSPTRSHMSPNRCSLSTSDFPKLARTQSTNERSCSNRRTRTSKGRGERKKDRPWRDRVLSRSRDSLRSVEKREHGREWRARVSKTIRKDEGNRFGTRRKKTRIDDSLKTSHITNSSNIDLVFRNLVGSRLCFASLQAKPKRNRRRASVPAFLLDLLSLPNPQPNRNSHQDFHRPTPLSHQILRQIQRFPEVATTVHTARPDDRVGGEIEDGELIVDFGFVSTDAHGEDHLGAAGEGEGGVG